MFLCFSQVRGEGAGCGQSCSLTSSGEEPSTSHHSLTGAHKASTSPGIPGLLSEAGWPGFGVLEGCQSTRTAGRRHSLALKQAGRHARSSTCCSPPLPSPRNASKAPGQVLSAGVCSTHETTAGVPFPGHGWPRHRAPTVAPRASLESIPAPQGSARSRTLLCKGAGERWGRAGLCRSENGSAGQCGDWAGSALSQWQRRDRRSLY